MLKQLKSRWFLIALAIALLLGYTQSSALQPLTEAKWLRQMVVAVVMFLMALPLGIGAMMHSLKNPVPAMLAVAMNAIAVPMAAWATSVPMGLLSTDMAAGLLIAGATPCTLASAAVWTRRAGGNDSVALMVTIITNLFCFLTTPFWLSITTGQQRAADPENSFTAMATKLLLLVVAPMALAQLLRLHRAFAQWATNQKVPIGVSAQAGILIMVLLGAIGAGQQMNSNLSELFGIEIVVMILAVLVIHVSVLIAGMFLAKALRQRREDQIAVGIAGSQKTLMVGLHMAASYFPDTLAMLPMIFYHAGQLLADTGIADALRKRGETGQPTNATTGKSGNPG